MVFEGKRILVTGAASGIGRATAIRMAADGGDVAIHAAPGDPARIYAGMDTATEEQIAAMRRDLGLDQPLPVQFGSYVKEIAQGNLGNSLAFRQPVVDLILDRWLRSHPEIAFLACKDSGYLGSSYLNGRQSKNELPVPVVIVTTKGEGAQALPHSDHNHDGSSVVA